MKLTELEKKLIAAARNNPPSDRVPFAFEKRVMSHLISRSVSDVWAVWAQALWRSAGACLAVVLLMGTISLFTSQTHSPAPGDLSQDFEKTMLAALDSDDLR